MKTTPEERAKAVLEELRGLDAAEAHAESLAQALRDAQQEWWKLGDALRRPWPSLDSRLLDDLDAAEARIKELESQLAVVRKVLRHEVSTDERYRVMDWIQQGWRDCAARKLRKEHRARQAAENSLHVCQEEHSRRCGDIATVAGQGLDLARRVKELEAASAEYISRTDPILARLEQCECETLRARCAQHLANARAADQTLGAHRSAWVREVGRKIRERAEEIEKR